MPAHDLNDLLTLMARLRDPETGCPWDRQQDFASLVPSTLEEAYELADAIAAEDPQAIREELGDLLFQVVFYARLGEERGWFRFTDLAAGLTEKLLRRHPHVFPDGRLESRREPGQGVDTASLGQRWERLKQQERAERQQTSLLDDVPLALPALSRAQKLQKRASLAAFDWPDAEAVLEKLDEERHELQEALAASDRDAAADELGDLLFTAVNVARHLKQDAETLLRRANERFEHRFRAMEQMAASQGQVLVEMSADARENLWQRIKQQESRSRS